MGNLSDVWIDPVLLAIDKAMEAQPQEKRTYLGMSQIGEPCERKLWLSYRYGNPPFDADALKRFEDGYYGEELMKKRLAMAGFEVFDSQKRVEDFDGRYAGHIDGLIRIPVSSKVHVWEHKQVNEKSFNELVKLNDLQKWNEKYYAQAQSYMHYLGLERHYMTVGTPGGRKYTSVRTKYSDRYAMGLRDKALRILEGGMPVRINENPSFYLCKMCNMRERCYG